MVSTAPTNHQLLDRGLDDHDRETELESELAPGGGTAVERPAAAKCCQPIVTCVLQALFCKLGTSRRSGGSGDDVVYD